MAFPDSKFICTIEEVDKRYKTFEKFKALFYDPNRNLCNIYDNPGFDSALKKCYDSEIIPKLSDKYSVYDIMIRYIGKNDKKPGISRVYSDDDNKLSIMVYMQSIDSFTSYYILWLAFQEDDKNWMLRSLR